MFAEKCYLKLFENLNFPNEKTFDGWNLIMVSWNELFKDLKDELLNRNWAYYLEFGSNYKTKKFFSHVERKGHEIVQKVNEI